jgi:hypothetical protein
MATITPSGGPIAVGVTVTGTPRHNRTAPGGIVPVNVTVSGQPTHTQLLIGAGFEVQIYDILNPSNLLAVVPNPETVQFEDVLSDVGSGQVTVATDDMNPIVFAKDHIWRILWEGREQFAFFAEQIEDDSVETDEIHRRTIAGRGAGQWLDKMKVYPAGMGTGVTTSPRPFNNLPMAAIYSQLLLEGQTRGVGTFISENGWSSTNDSEGIPWTDTNQLQVAAGTSMLELLNEFGAAIPFDWHMDSRFGLTLAKQLGQDRSATVRVQPVGSVESAAVTSDRTSLWDVVLLEDANNGFSEQFDSTAISTWGRRELYASSQTVVDSTGRADLSFQLVQQFKNQNVQRLVQISTSTLGRKPFVDFGVGDIISVEFTDGTITNSRVIAIAMTGGDTVAEEAQVTLDFVLGGSQQQLNTSTSLAYTGPVMVYADNTGSPFSITTSILPVINLQLVANTQTSVTCDSYIRGQASVALTMEADVVLNGSIIRTMKQIMQAGEQTFTPTFVIPALPSGTNTAQLRLSVSTGTFAIASGDLQHWYQGQGLQGGIPVGATEIDLVDNIVITLPTITTATPILSHPSPVTITPAADTIVQMTVTTTDTELITPGYVESITGTGNDGSNNSSGTFTTTATQLEVGNDGGVIYGFYTLFGIPSPSIPAGATITYARLVGVANATDANVQALIRAERSASPTAPTSSSDFLSRTRTTASAVWSTPVTSGVSVTSVDFTNVIQELVTAFGNAITAISVYVEDNSSPVNGKLTIRSFENVSGTPPQLVVRWHV